MKAMILAAGRGERMGFSTQCCPKPLLPLGSKCLIEYQIEALVKAHFSEIVINVAYLPEQFIEKLGEGHRWRARIQYVQEPLGFYGTGGGIMNALPLLGDQPFLVTSGDIWTGFPYESLRTIQLGQDRLAHLILVDNPSDHPEGDFYLSVPFSESVSQTIRTRAIGAAQKLTFANIGVYHPKLFSGFVPEHLSLGFVLRRAIQHGQATGCYFAGQWTNINCFEHWMALKDTLVEKATGPQWIR